MQKKDYIAPEVELELFTIGDVITASAGIGDGGNEGGDLDALFEPDAVVVNSQSGEVNYYLDENGDQLDAADVESVY